MGDPLTNWRRRQLINGLVSIATGIGTPLGIWIIARGHPHWWIIAGMMVLDSFTRVMILYTLWDRAGELEKRVDKLDRAS